MFITYDQHHMLYERGWLIVKGYLISVIAAAIFSAVLMQLAGKDSLPAMALRLLTGIFVAVVAMKPIFTVELKQLAIDWDEMIQSADRHVMEGQSLAAKEKSAIISENTQAYIQNKAKQMGVNVCAEVELDGDIPAGVRIIGTVTPYERSVLSVWIEETLAIPLEEQQWLC